MLRSAIALVAGFAILTFALLGATIVVALVLGVEPGAPTTAFLATVLACGGLAAAFGGYSTAALAPSRHAAHVLGLAAMIVLTDTSSLLHPRPGQPIWYLVTTLVVQPLLAVAGGRLRTHGRPAAAGYRQPSRRG